MKKNKILVVEDSPIQRKMLKLDLELQSYKVTTANDGFEGVNRVYTDEPDLIISDILMPKLNGYQLCRLLKNDPKTNHIPIILLSNLGQKLDKFWGVEAGADSYLFKKSRLQELLDEIDRLLQQSSSQSKSPELTIDHSELNNQIVNSRINNMLDRLLFESTITNRIREISKFAYNPQELMINFFNLLSQLVDYSIAGVLIQQSELTYLYLNLNKFCDQETIEQIKSEILAERTVIQESAKIKLEIFGEKYISDDKNEFRAKSSVSFDIKEGVQGTLTIFDNLPETYSDDTRQVLQIICKELGMLIKYLLKIEEIETIKADFTSMIVHDLRSPMAGVLGLLQLMRYGKTGIVNDQQKKLLSQVLVTLNKVVNLVNDVLDVSKIEAGRLDLQKTHIQLFEVIESAINNIKILAEEKYLIIKNEYPKNLPQIAVDETRIEQVFVNLISNAIKFSPPNGEIFIGATCANKFIKLWVRDSGIGIPADELDKIFDKYQQTKKFKSSFRNGTGLGLVICKMVIQAHGGNIWVESEEGVGSTFYFTLPVENTVNF